MPRLFVALELDAATRAHAVEVAASLRRTIPTGARVRWTRPESLHLTLVFLGSVEASKVEAIEGVLARVASELGPLEAELGGVGVFGRPDRARVLWLGFGEGDERLGALVREVEDGLRGAGLAIEARAWRGHVTLARAAERSGLDARALLAAGIGVRERPLRCPVDALVLMESRSTSEGSAYHPLQRVRLTGPPRR